MKKMQNVECLFQLKFFLIFLVIFFPFCPVLAIKQKNSKELFAIYASKKMHHAPTIVLDAGHGGTDLGAKASKPYCEEKKIALTTAFAVKKYLMNLGYNVIMTRSTDSFIPLWRRVQIANKASSTLFVSLHFNSSSSASANGIEVFFTDSKENQLRAKASQKLAHAILSRVIQRTKAISRGVKKGNFYVIRETEMPAVLVEGGFISNFRERSLMKDPAYIEQIARGVADGVDHYFRKLL